jgi:magnesium transporter
MPDLLAVPDTASLLGTAAAHLTSRVPRGAAADRVEAVRAALVGVGYDSVAAVAVCDEEERLVGLATLERVLAAPAAAVLADVMDPDPPIVGPGVVEERAAWHMVNHGETSLGVVDERGRFVGLIPPQRMLAVLLEEHEEDLSRLAGVLHETTVARVAGEETVARRFWHRLPWLLVGLLGALLAAGAVGTFEDQLAEEIILAFFLPGVVYMADAVGTQTETVVIRALSVGVPIRRMARREVLTGLAVGLVVSLVFSVVAVLVWGETDVAIAVGVALLVACSVASAVAMVLPWVLSRAGVDPAFGSGPLATVIQDLLSIVSYLLIVSAVVG